MWIVIAAVWMIGMLIAAYAGAPAIAIWYSLILWFLWTGWHIKQRKADFTWFG